MIRCLAAMTMLVLPLTARAETPTVVADIAPLHSLVSQVMAGKGAPDLLLPANISPHDYALRPSDARALQDAEVVFWTSAALTPHLPGQVANISPNATVVEMAALKGVVLLDAREWDQDDHDHDHDHGKGGYDPHLWLDPENAKIWLQQIANTLSGQDPENEALYRTNALKAQVAVSKTIAQIDAIFEPVRANPFVVSHDAFHYFEDRFGLATKGALSLSDDAPPSAGQIRHLQRIIVEESVVCILGEPQTNQGHIDNMIGDQPVKTALLDPLGKSQELGAGLYNNVLMAMAQQIATCVGD